MSPIDWREQVNRLIRGNCPPELAEKIIDLEEMKADGSLSAEQYAEAAASLDCETLAYDYEHEGRAIHLFPTGEEAIVAFARDQAEPNPDKDARKEIRKRGWEPFFTWYEEVEGNVVEAMKAIAKSSKYPVALPHADRLFGHVDRRIRALEVQRGRGNLPWLPKLTWTSSGKSRKLSDDLLEAWEKFAAQLGRRRIGASAD